MHSDDDSPGSEKRPRVIHFVTGGFTGSTQAAIDVVEGSLRRGRTEPLLVLRRKRHTDPAAVARLRERGLPVEVIPAWPKWRVVRDLVRLCRRFRADAIVGWGFSEHLWARYAGLIAGVPVRIQVEQGWERYRWWRAWQSHWLARRTTRIIACSEGIRERLERLGFPRHRLVAIPNAIHLEKFAAADEHPFAARTPGLIVPARFASSKDHPTLLRALALLRQRGLRPPAILAGRGKPLHRARARILARRLGLTDQVVFAGQRKDLPELLLNHRFCVLATHREGMPLALIEGMAAGCAVVASDVPGVHELIDDGRTGRLVPPADPVALADVLEQLLRSPDRAAALARAARARALAEHGIDLMVDRYEAVCAPLPPAGSVAAARQ